MIEFNPLELKKLYTPPADSHKGQNGKLLIIGGSHLFHAPPLWALNIASKIVDMVYFSSTPENNAIAKDQFRNGIIVKREQIDSYIEEADCILIGPGLPRKEGEEAGDDDTKELTERLLKQYPDKKWVLDGGSLQTIDPSLIPSGSILTPHRQEFKKLFELKIQNSKFKIASQNVEVDGELAREIAKEYDCIILLKGQVDIVCNPTECVSITGGNAGMTKGGTGDVLAGLVAAFNCKNDPFLAAKAGSYINKKAGESLEKRVGLYFNSSDLVQEIPEVMKKHLSS